VGSLFPRYERAGTGQLGLQSNIQIQKADLGAFSMDAKAIPASDLERSKDVTCLTGASKAVLHGRSQEATVGGWLKSARQSGSSDGLRVSVI
jgi:hypothetical protein